MENTKYYSFNDIFQEYDKGAIDFYTSNGYLAINDVLNDTEIEKIASIYDDFLSGKIDTAGNRSDLGGHAEKTNDKIKENITQIMHPGSLHPALLNEPIYVRCTKLAKILMGNDIALDFDMLINKAPHSNTKTPWHQDMSYWMDMPDKRAVSFWIAIDNSTLENGCMWFGPESHLEPARKHWQVGKAGSAMECLGDEKEALYVPLTKGSCTAHHGGTLHYSRGNITNTNRRALILNYRPESMIQMERKQGFDHSGVRENK